MLTTLLFYGGGAAAAPSTAYKIIFLIRSGRLAYEDGNTNFYLEF